MTASLASADIVILIVILLSALIGLVRGLIKEVMVDPVRKFYDSTTHPHHHFYNVDSGELSDIPDEQVNFAGLPDLPEGTERESVEVLIKVRDQA